MEYVFTWIDIKNEVGEFILICLIDEWKRFKK